MCCDGCTLPKASPTFQVYVTKCIFDGVNCQIQGRTVQRNINVLPAAGLGLDVWASLTITERIIINEFSQSLIAGDGFRW